MRLAEVVEALGLEVASGPVRLDREIRGGYASDLMSDVLAHTRPGDLWVTLQTHPNIVAVAVMKELSAVILIGGRAPQEATLRRAREEAVPLLRSALPAFELIGRLYRLGIPGCGATDGESGCGA